MSSGGSKNSTVTQTTQFPPQFMPYAQQILDQGMATAQQPYQPYPGQLVAPQSEATQLGQGLTVNRALQGLSGGVEQAASQQAQQTLQGGYLGYSPGVNQYMGLRTPVGYNPMIGQMSPVGTNQYAGQNPFLEQNIQGALGDISRNYAVGTAAQTDAAASRARALGGSAYNELQGIQSGELAKRLGEVSSGMRMQDYATQQALAEADINRRLGAYQTDIGRTAGLLESDIARRAGTAQTDIARNAALAESGLGREQQLFSSERENQMRALGLAPVTQQMDYANLQAIQGVGAGQEAYQQRQLDSAYQQWLAQQQYPYQQAQFGAGLLAPLAGSQSQNVSPYAGPSTLQSVLGTGLTGAAAGYAFGPALGAQMGTAISPGVGTILGGLFGAGLGYLGSR